MTPDSPGCGRADEVVAVIQEDRELRKELLKTIVEALDRPCSDGDMIDDRTDALDQVIARHRLNTSAEPAERKDEGRVAELEAALRSLHDRIELAWPELANLPPMVAARATLNKSASGGPSHEEGASSETGQPQFNKDAQP